MEASFSSLVFAPIKSRNEWLVFAWCGVRCAVLDVFAIRPRVWSSLLAGVHNM